MSSPFRRHQQQVLAAQAAGTAIAAATGPAEPDAASPAGREYATLRVLLHENLRALKDIASHDARNPKKREMAAAFTAWVDGVIAADAPVQDEIVLTCMIWAVDYRDFDRALQLARFVIAHGLEMPAPFTRTPACFLVEQVAELALKDAPSAPTSVTIEHLLAVQGLTATADMPDPVRAKLAKAIGRARLAQADGFDPAAESAIAGGKPALLQDALKWLAEAKRLDSKAGVTKDLEAATRALKAATPEPTQ